MEIAYLFFHDTLYLDWNNVLNWLEENDLFFVDCGFSDLLVYLKELRMKAVIPSNSFLTKGEKQLLTQDARGLRMFSSKFQPWFVLFYWFYTWTCIYHLNDHYMYLSQIRWLVESANALIKRWEFLDRTMPTSQVPYIADYIKKACFISNKYFPPLSTGGSQTTCIFK